MGLEIGSKVGLRLSPLKEGVIGVSWQGKLNLGYKGPSMILM